MEYYLARDGDGDIRLFQEEPYKSQYFENMWIGYNVKIDNNLFPEITWDNSPVKVTINIEKDEQVNEIIQEGEAKDNIAEPEQDVHQEEQ